MTVIAYKVDTYQIRCGTPAWLECDLICKKSKDLYNSANYYQRQRFFNPDRSIKTVGFSQLAKVMQLQESYSEMPAKLAQLTIKNVTDAWTAYYKALASFRKNPEKFLSKPKPPKYKDTRTGRCLVEFNIQAISKKHLKDGFLKLSSLEFLTPMQRTIEHIELEDIDRETGEVLVRKVCNLRSVIIRPAYDRYEVIVRYAVPQVKPVEAPKGSYLAGIDLGVNNLVAVATTNKSKRNFIINGRPLKSMNQFFNKRLAELRSALDVCVSKRGKKNITRKIKVLCRKRHNKIKDFLHKASTLLVNQLVSSGVFSVVIGKNVGWKQDINMGKVNNQNFVQIPHARFIEMFRYKWANIGRTSDVSEESYTSKCSFLDGESIEFHNSYVGKRVRRGLFQTKNGHLVNADIQGGANILKKVISNAWDLWSKADLIEGFVVSPVRLTTNQLHAVSIKK